MEWEVPIKLLWSEQAVRHAVAGDGRYLYEYWRHVPYSYCSLVPGLAGTRNSDASPAAHSAKSAER
jgi:hypothetical protein